MFVMLLTHMQFSCVKINFIADSVLDVYLSLCDKLLGDRLSPTEASPKVISQLQVYAGIDNNCTDSKQLAVVAFLYVFCGIAPTNG